MKTILITFFTTLITTQALAQLSTIPTARYEITTTTYPDDELITTTEIVELKVVGGNLWTTILTEQKIVDGKSIDRPIQFLSIDPPFSAVFRKFFTPYFSSQKLMFKACKEQSLKGDVEYSIGSILLNQERIEVCNTNTYTEKSTTSPSFPFAIIEAEFINPENLMETSKIKLLKYSTPPSPSEFKRLLIQAQQDLKDSI